MYVTLINCDPVLKPQNMDLWKGAGIDAFNQKVNGLLPNWVSWNYGIDNVDKMIITLPDGTVIPDLSSIGEVVPNDNTMG